MVGSLSYVEAVKVIGKVPKERSVISTSLNHGENDNNNEWEIVDLQGIKDLESNNSNEGNLYHCQLAGINVEDVSEDSLREAISSVLVFATFKEDCWMVRKATFKDDLHKCIKNLQRQGIILHTRKIHIDRDVMVNWVNLVFEQDLRVMVE